MNNVNRRIKFIGQANQRGKNQILTYSGGGEWQTGTKDAADPAKLVWNTVISPMDENAGMSGTYNGAVERLGELMADRAKEVDYFPAEPCDQFANDLVVGTFTKPIRGVALYDFAGTGRPGIYACSDGGDRIYLQTGPLKFTDATAKLGLTGVSSRSVSFADINADGRPDLLAGATLFLAEGDGDARTFKRSELLPAKAGENLLCAAFMEVNGDGYPDVVASHIGGGLSIYLNPGAAGGPFSDASEKLGERSQMGMLHLFVALLGGVAAFGFIGLILGPVVMAVALSVFRAYALEQSETPKAHD